MFRVCGWYDSRAQVSALEHSTGLRPLASRTPNVLTTQSSAGMGVLGMLGVAEVLGLG